MRCLFLPVGLFSTVVHIPNGGGDLLPSRKSDKNVKMHPLALVAKGQIISKAICVFLTSPKKRTKKSKNLTRHYNDISSQIFFVRFFGESRTP